MEQINTIEILPGKTGWHKLTLNNSNKDLYLNGNIEIEVYQKNKQIIPNINLPNVLFKNNIVIVNIPFLNLITIKLNNKSNIKMESIKLGLIKENGLKADLWHFRRCFDLEFLNYYLKFPEYNDFSNEFKVRVNTEYSLLKNPDYDFGFRPIKINKKGCLKKTLNVLYLVGYTIEHRHIGYTIRTHQLLKNVTSNNDNINVYGVSQYGYPYNIKLDASNKDKIKDKFELDNVTYLKLLDNTDKTDNRNTNDLISYIRKYIGKVIELAIRLDIDIVHGITDYVNGLVALNVGRCLGIKSIYEVRGFWEDNIYKKEIEGSDILKMKYGLENYVISNVSSVITINKFLLNEIVDRTGICGDDIKIIYNGVDIDRFKPTVAEDKQNIVIGYIGSVLEYEGLDYILNSVFELNNLNDVIIKFIIVGEGSYKKELEKIVLKLDLVECVEFVGVIPYDEVVKYYNMFDIVAYPRRNNKVCSTTSSSKVFEAMAMSKAILVSELDAWTEIIKDGYTGLYCIADNQNSITDKLKSLVLNMELRKFLGTNARQWVSENRAWKSSCTELIKIWK